MSSAVINRRCQVCSASLKSQAQICKVFLKGSAIDMLGQYIVGIVLSGYFGQTKVTCSEAVLDPQIRRCKVADLPQAASPTDANCRCGIGLNLEGPNETQILGDRDQTQRSVGAAANSCEFCFCRAKCHRWLGG